MPRGTVRGTTDPARHPERTRMRRGRPLTGEHATVVALLGGNKLESSTSDSCPGEALQLDLFCCRLILKHVGRNGIIIIYLSVSIEMQTERVENERNITAVDLFAGCGGMSLGFEKAGVNVVAAYDNWDAAIDVYRANFQHPVFKRDLSDVSVSEEVAGFAPDIIIGGPPCQPFSNANRHEDSRGSLHPEGDMFAHYLRLVRESGVRAFLIENVPGLLSASMGHYMDLIKAILPDYSVSAKVITDCDLGGYTKRKRAVLIGSKGEPLVIPDVKMRPVRTAGEALSRVKPDWPNFSDVTVSSEWVRKKISMIPEGGNWHDLPEKYWTKSVHSNMYRRVDRNRPSISIANWRKFLLSPPKWTDSAEWDRILTVSEAAALQGLDKHFAFSGSLNSMQQQVANGVTAAIARFCKNILAGLFGRPAVMAD